MGEYGYLACMDCRLMLWFGKALKDEGGRVFTFHQGDAEQPRVFESPFFCRAVFKLLTEHVGHELRTCLEYSLPPDLVSVDVMFGGIENYVGDWPKKPASE